MAKGCSRKRLLRASVFTLIAVYLLILVGSIVRTTGSGMGCPDWPKCFGQYIPPTNVDQLESNYQERFLKKRLAKAERLSNVLASVGLVGLSEKIINDPNLKKEEKFNPTKTWIEYLNRLLGATVGILCLITLYAGYRIRKIDKRFFLIPLGILILTGLEGWFGSIVVVTNLLPGTITIHMFLAIGIILLLIWLVHITQPISFNRDQVNLSIYWPIGLMILVVSQIYMGTQVRESIDHLNVVSEGTGREEWLDRIGVLFYAHRSYSLIILAIQFFIVVKLLNTQASLNNIIFAINLLIFGVSIIEVVSGAYMYYFGIPKYLQPLHLLLAVVMIGALFMLTLIISRQNKIEINKI